MLGFFFIEPGPGAGERCASKTFDSLCSFQIADKLLATVTNNCSNAIKGADTLADLLKKKFGNVILWKENRRRCVLHTWQIAVKAACEVIQKQNGNYP